MKHGDDADEGGEDGAKVKLPPDLDFALRIALIRGHLLVGDELVKRRPMERGAAALPASDRGTV